MHVCLFSCEVINLLAKVPPPRLPTLLILFLFVVNILISSSKLWTSSSPALLPAEKGLVVAILTTKKGPVVVAILATGSITREASLVGATGGPRLPVPC